MISLLRPDRAELQDHTFKPFQRNVRAKPRTHAKDKVFGAPPGEKGPPFSRAPAAATTHVSKSYKGKGDLEIG